MENQYELLSTSRRPLRGAKLPLVEDNAEQCALTGRVLRQCMPEVDLLVASTG